MLFLDPSEVHFWSKIGPCRGQNRFILGSKIDRKLTLKRSGDMKVNFPKICLALQLEAKFRKTLGSLWTTLRSLWVDFGVPSVDFGVTLDHFGTL